MALNFIKLTFAFQYYKTDTDISKVTKIIKQRH